MATQTIQIGDIIIPEVRSNAVYSLEKYQELKLSIAQAGIQYRPSVRMLPDGKYEIIDGRHRVQVWKELGHNEIEVDVESLSDEQAFVKHVVANHHRGESDPVGLGKVIKKLKDGGKTLEDIGKLIGYSGSQAAQYLQLAYLPEQYQQAVSEGKLKLAHIKEVLRLEVPIEMDAALSYTLQLGWTANVLHHYVENRINELSVEAARDGAVPGEMIQPPAPSPELAQYRTCLICGAQGHAHEMFYPALGKECHDTLIYLKQINKNPWNALQELITDMQNMQHDLEAKDQKIKELSERLIDLSLRLVPGPAVVSGPEHNPWQPTQAGSPRPNTQ